MRSYPSDSVEAAARIVSARDAWTGLDPAEAACVSRSGRLEATRPHRGGFDRVVRFCDDLCSAWNTGHPGRLRLQPELIESLLGEVRGSRSSSACSPSCSRSGGRRPQRMPRLRCCRTPCAVGARARTLSGAWPLADACIAGGNEGGCRAVPGRAAQPPACTAEYVASDPQPCRPFGKEEMNHAESSSEQVVENRVFVTVPLDLPVSRSSEADADARRRRGAGGRGRASRRDLYRARPGRRCACGRPRRKAHAGERSDDRRSRFGGSGDAVSGIRCT